MKRRKNNRLSKWEKSDKNFSAEKYVPGISETGDISGIDDITEIGVSETGDNMEGKSWVYYRSQDNIAMLTRRLIRALDTLQKTPKIIKIKKNSKE